MLNLLEGARAGAVVWASGGRAAARTHGETDGLGSPAWPSAARTAGGAWRQEAGGRIPARGRGALYP